MSNKRVKTAQLERISELIRLIRTEAERVQPEEEATWQEWHDRLEALLKSVWWQSARPHAAPDLADVAEAIAGKLLALLRDSSEEQVQCHGGLSAWIHTAKKSRGLPHIWANVWSSTNSTLHCPSSHFGTKV